MIDRLHGRDINTIYFETRYIEDKEELELKVKEVFKSQVGIAIIAKAVTIGELPRSEKKTTRVFDNRY